MALTRENPLFSCQVSAPQLDFFTLPWHEHAQRNNNGPGRKLLSSKRSRLALQNFKRWWLRSVTSAKRDSPIAMRGKAKLSCSFVNVCDTRSASVLKNTKRTGTSKFGQRTKPKSRRPSLS